MNIFMVHVGNFVGMCKFYFMNMAKFCGYEYGEFVGIWKNFVGMKFWLWKYFCWVCDVKSWEKILWL